jgi:hypothetical protein
MYEQRKVVQEFFDLRDEEKFWSPRVDRDGKESVESEMGMANWYAVVDDIAEGTVVLQIASWPKLDKGNHLRFDEIYVQSYPLDALQQLVNKERIKNNQPAADRPLRTGDAFSIECDDRPSEDILSPEFKGSILDITASAREQAKIAMYSAVTRKLSPSEVDDSFADSNAIGRFQQLSKTQDRQEPLGPIPFARTEG